MARRKKKQLPPFEGPIRDWGVGYLKKNRWKIAAMCDNDDIFQMAYLGYITICRKHPQLTDPTSFFRMYKVWMGFYLRTVARRCFPNPYNVSEKYRCFSLTRENGSDREVDSGSVYTTVGMEFEGYLELMQKLPGELRDAFTLLVREFVGGGDIPTRTRPSLDGRSRREPLQIALARAVGVDRRRDLLSEIGTALGISNNEEAKGAK